MRPIHEFTVSGLLSRALADEACLPASYQRIACIFRALQDGSKGTRALRNELKLSHRGLKAWRQAYNASIEEGHIVATPAKGRPKKAVVSYLTEFDRTVDWLKSNRGDLRRLLKREFSLNEFLKVAKEMNAPLGSPRHTRRALRAAGMLTVGQLDFDIRTEKQ